MFLRSHGLMVPRLLLGSPTGPPWGPPPLPGTPPRRGVLAWDRSSQGPAGSGSLGSAGLGLGSGFGFGFSGSRLGFRLGFRLDFGWIWIWLSFTKILGGFDLAWFDFGWFRLDFGWIWFGLV